MIVQPDRRRILERQALGIVSAGGGWNDRTRARIAALALANGVDAAELMQWAMAALAADAAVPGVPSAQAAASAGPGVAVADARTTAPRTRSMGLGARLAILAAAFAVSVALVLYALERAERLRRPAAEAASAPTAPAGRERAPAAGSAPTPGPAEAPTAAAGVSGSPRAVPPVPAMYARPPALRIDGAPPWSRPALETVAADEQELLATQARLAAGTPASEADRALWKRVASAFLRCWPLLEDARRAEVIGSLAASFARLGDAEVRAQLRTDVEPRVTEDRSLAEALWCDPGFAGLSVVLGTPGADPVAAFSEGALAALAPRGPETADVVIAGEPAAAADAVDAWLQATEAATSPTVLRGERDNRILSLLDRLVRRDAPMSRPGTSADAAGTLLDALGWTGDAARRAGIEASLRAWFEDPSVSAASLHGLTSVLASHRPGRWWEPWLVSAERADMAERARTADRFRAALASGAGEDLPPEPRAGSRLRGVPPDLVDRWLRVARKELAAPLAEDAAERTAVAAAQVAMVEAVRLLERGRLSDAQARIAQVEDPQGIAVDDLDRWKGRVERTPGRASGPDGRLEQDLRARGTAEDRAAFLRSLRSRSIGDLGPGDAATLAREALASPSRQLRAAAQAVVTDILQDGPNTVAALAAEAHAAVDASEAAALAGAIARQPVPRGTDADRRAKAALLLMDHHATLVPSDRHRIDSVSREFVFSANAVTSALGGEALPSDAAPEASLARWLQARLAESRGVLPPAVASSLAARAEGRRRLALPGPQQAVAELVSILELESAIVAERTPRLRPTVDAIVRRSAAERLAAADVIAQLCSASRALLEVAVAGVAPQGEGTP